jgi:hypothetical protein
MLVGAGPDFKHGVNGYRVHLCRCETCESAYDAWVKDQAQRRAATDYGDKYYERNKDHPVYKAKKVAYMQALKDIPTPNEYKLWTPEEDAVILRSDIGVVEMCYMLGRSYYAVVGRRKTLRKAA